MARGLGGLIGVGREQKRQALAGLTKAAQLETQTDVANMQLDAQKQAAQMNLVGTAGGIAGASYLSKRAAKKAAEEVAKNVAVKGAETAATTAATTAGTTGGAAATTGAAAGGGGGAMASIGAAAPYVLLALAGGYLLKKIFD